jgi:hypothetical protein
MENTWWCYHPLQCVPTYCDEGDLKYGNRDIASSSLVFPRSKGEEAGGKPLLESIYKDKLKISFE